MSDLLKSMEEHHEERLAIMQESGVPNADEAAIEDLHRCEIKSVMRRYYPNGKKAADYFEQVEKARGHLAAQRLRDDVRAEWKKRNQETARKA